MHITFVIPALLNTRQGKFPNNIITLILWGCHPRDAAAYAWYLLESCRKQLACMQFYFWTWTFIF